MQRWMLLVVSVVAAIAMTGTLSAAAAKPRPRPAKQVAALKRQVATLKRQVTALRAQVRRLQAENAALSPAGIARQLADAKAVNDRFQSVAAAEAAGYVRASPCEATPAGGMGFHYSNPQLVADPALDPTRPEVLVYAPSPTGPVLVAAEWLKFDADQNLSTDDDRPALFGRAFDGPMLGHGPGMPIHYDLHVWLWKRNPTGIFAQWNPDVRCS